MKALRLMVPISPLAVQRLDELKGRFPFATKTALARSALEKGLGVMASPTLMALLPGTGKAEF
jgi:hypothetical protein